MPITVGSLSARVWRVTESLPPRFNEIFERNLKRHAFRPVDVEKGELRSIGWVNIRQVLDAEITLEKVLFKNTVALGLRVDRVTINPRLFRARLSEEIAKLLKNKGRDRLSDEQRLALEDKLRLELIRKQPPSMSVYEMAWKLESGLLFFAATGNRINIEFAELFTQTFNLSLEPQFPFLRAERWAKRQKLERELREALPSPFSPLAPVEVIDIERDTEAGS